MNDETNTALTSEILQAHASEWIADDGSKLIGNFTWYETGDGLHFATCSISGNVALIGSAIASLVVRSVYCIPGKWCEEGERCFDVSCPLNKTTYDSLEKAFGGGKIPLNWRRLSKNLGESIKPASSSRKTLPRIGKRRPIKARKRYRILKRDHFRCRTCGRAAPDVILHLDHIIPVSKGGSDDDDNLRVLCQECNLGKAAT